MADCENQLNCSHYIAYMSWGWVLSLNLGPIFQNKSQKFNHRNFPPVRTGINNQLMQRHLKSLYTITELCVTFLQILSSSQMIRITFSS